ncbi:aminomethyltransferase [Paraburkholderia caballeronis]|nr:aminomethyltransferase [Paraburkholderia caballeronis]
MTPRPPSVSRPYEPALSADHERSRVAGGELGVVELQPGDELRVIDVEGLQPAELLALHATHGGCALDALGLTADPQATFIAGLLERAPAHIARLGLSLDRLPASAALWPSDTPAGHARSFTARESVVALIAAPGVHAPLDAPGRQPTELEIVVRRAQPSDKPRAHEPLAEPLADFVIPPGTAIAYTVKTGEYVQIVDVAGRQCSDFVAFDLAALGHGEVVDLDPTVTRTLNGSAYPAPGLFSRFYDRNMQPMLEVVRDTVGRHDSFALACTARYYDAQGYPGHANCSDNISAALEAFGVPARPGWPAINFFFNTGIDAGQQITLDEPWSRPGDYVLLRALKDLVCVSTSCPDDIDPANGWNPTDIQVRTYSSKERFSVSLALRSTPDAPAVLTRESGFHPRTAALTKRFTDYRGWWLPTQFEGYGPIDEYYGCRERAAIMDLSALRKFDVIGPDAEALLQYCLTRDVRRLAVGQVVYSAMCYPHGGMLDDGTLMRFGPDNFRWICGEDFAGIWLREQAQKLGMKVWIKSASAQIHNVALQGPQSRAILQSLIWTPGTQPSLDTLGWFRFLVGRLDGYDGHPVIVSRTGYTGELGYEIWCHPDHAPAVWDRVWAAGQPHGLVPLGFDALDTLRIEAGLAFAGHEFSDETDPFEAGIGFCVPLKTKTDDFIGRDALLRRSAHPQRRLVGLELDGNEPAGHGDCVHDGRAQIGVVTSATRSPLTGRQVALCRLDVGYAEAGTVVQIGKLDGQQKRIDARVAAPIFYDPEKARVRS